MFDFPFPPVMRLDFWNQVCAGDEMGFQGGGGQLASNLQIWRGDKDASEYLDMPGFCKAANLDAIRNHAHVLTPGRYVGAEAAEDDGEPFEEKMKRLAATLREQQAEAANLDAAILANLKELRYGGD